MSLPISVVIPHVQSRKDFLRRFCLPSVEANKPAEILVEPNSGGGTGAHWRNVGASKATQPFLFFCDDDIILAVDCLEKLLHALVWAPQGVRYCYCDLMSISLPGGHQFGDQPVAICKGAEWTPHDVRRGSVCSSMILIERDAFPGFDGTLEQLDDWDLCLTLLERGARGLRFPEVLLYAFYLDQGVSNRRNIVKSVHAVQRKHRMKPGA